MHKTITISEDDLVFEISKFLTDIFQAPGLNVVTTQPQPPLDSLPPATEETPYDPTEDQDIGAPQTENRY